jgi:pimeloyl-ACP methyl ester carboxylesterase
MSWSEPALRRLCRQVRRQNIELHHVEESIPYHQDTERTTLGGTDIRRKGGLMIREKSTGLPRSVFAIGSALALVALVWVGGGGHAAATLQVSSDPRPTIVLVHGDWADASSWNAVIAPLQDRGFTVVAPPNTLRGPSQDAPYLASYLQSLSGPIVLVAHSYGGFVITNAATGNPNVKALVYIDAFVPDENETALDLVGGTTSCVTDNGAFNAVPIDGGLDLYLRWEADPPYAGFMGCFANGVDEETAAVLAATQRPASAAQFSEPSGAPAWNTIPSWALLGTLDNVIPPALQEEMYERAGAHISRVKTGHLSLITRPGAVVRVILSAVEATT